MGLSLPFESRYVTVKRLHDMHRRSIEAPKEFWGEQARQLDWFRTWDRVLEWEPPFARWFTGGRLNAAHLCVDRQVRTGTATSGSSAGPTRCSRLPGTG